MFNNTQLSFLHDFIACKSITPEDNGAIDAIIKNINPAAKTHKLVFGEGKEKVTNLYAEIGSGPTHLCFAGHSDVVPPGDRNQWLADPFKLMIQDNIAYGRGMVDMKGAVFSFILALEEFLSENQDEEKYRISLLISGNEEGDPRNGMVELIRWLHQNKVKIDDCIIGEPTSKEMVGDVIKIGRRGSISFTLTIHGIQGHVAYPQKADNPIRTLTKILNELITLKLDSGNKNFQPSNLEVTNIEVGNNANNVIPAKATVSFNIRYNNIRNGIEIKNLIEETINKHTNKYALSTYKSGDAFINKNPDLINVVKKSITETIPTLTPRLSTDGGTSDARFLKDICNTIEVGLKNSTAHKINESCHIEDLWILSKIYKRILDNYFFNGMAR